MLDSDSITTSLAASRLRLRARTLCNHCNHWADAAGTVVSHIDASCLSFSGPLRCRNQLQRYWAGSHVGDMWYGLLERECFFLAARLASFSWPFDQHASWDDTEARWFFRRLCTHACSCRVLGSSTSQIDVASQWSCSQLYRTVLGSAVYPYPLVSWHCREAPRRRTEAAWKCSASHNGIQARLVGE